MPPFLDQTTFRGRFDDGDEDNATWKTALVNQDWSQVTNQNFRCRFVVHNGGFDPTTDQFRLQYRLNGGSWTNVTNAVDDEGNFIIIASGSTFFLSGIDCTQQIGSGLFIVNNNGMEDVNAITEAPCVVSVNFEFECEFCLKLGPLLIPGDTIELRVVRQNGTPFNAYTEIPLITVQVVVLALESTVLDIDSLSPLPNLTGTGSLTATITNDLDLPSSSATIYRQLTALVSDSDTTPSSALLLVEALSTILTDQDSLTGTAVGSAFLEVLTTDLDVPSAVLLLSTLLTALALDTDSAAASADTTKGPPGPSTSPFDGGYYMASYYHLVVPNISGNA